MPASEKERMLAGELYDATDPELVADMARAQALLRELNRLDMADPARHGAILAELFGAIGADVVVKTPFRCDYGSQIRIGAGTFVNYDCIFLDCAAIEIGARVQIAPGVHIYTATHPLDASVRAEGLESALPVRIGDDVWIGGRAVILPGVSVGARAVIGAGAVVARDVPPDTLVLGSPARVVRRIGAGDHTEGAA
ncbi:sugar O-acetyltransferase [Propylenella binzhouense]|uniref:Nodulation protein L n=1 Tax=Propylenella binzhouense TaxID=2555902 RepID=A0A964T514_9HYPH|nr:sugar O-acetyltransferase [Propylenella binzhouense]MYZ48641.1 sugar O-acetyltransferase [Propylenella binzhouense]